jgi:rod shape-determining protein MreD
VADVRRLLLSVLLVLAAIVIQLTVLDRLPLPGDVSPDLVLLVVVALALSSGPMAGMITGFLAGLALDIAPPSDHLIGVYALVFCLVGYFCGRIAADLDATVLLPLAASAAGAAAGAALYAGLGILLGDADVTGPAVRHVLPETVLYDVLLSPFVLYAVALASRLAARLAGAPAEGPQTAGPLVAPGPHSLPAGRTPRIRAAAARQRDGWIGGGGWLAASAELARSRPTTVHLHLGGKRTGPLPGRAASPQGASAGKGVARLRFGTGRRGDGVVGGRLLGGGFLAGLSGTGRVVAGTGSPRLFTRRSRSFSALTRFGSRPAWGFRGAGGSGFGGSVLRRGSFSTNTRRKVAASAATPRRGTFTAPPQRKRMPATGSPRRGAFSGGSSTKGTFGAGSPRRGAFSGPRRLRALRRVSRRGGNPLRRRGVMGRVRRGRSSTWRIGSKRNGGYR